MQYSTHFYPAVSRRTILHDTSSKAWYDWQIQGGVSHPERS